MLLKRGYQPRRARKHFTGTACVDTHAFSSPWIIQVLICDNRFRVFYMACSELFRMDGGEQ